jgi:uncharacterized iron-regulated membrane protein
MDKALFLAFCLFVAGLGMAWFVFWLDKHDDITSRSKDARHPRHT